MSYTAMYRKKRPLAFGAVVGQAHVVRTLLNQLSAGHISHAYLFCGTRGTGKTTVARIFARAVNCENPRGGEPCNECDTCRGILAERNLSVTEIDAASNNGVENIRDLREEVKYPPAEGKYRVYIIDEAHMLTASAFNALLKTLEEPPPFVIFILATTDPQKLPVTILSRCQRYDFKRIAAEDMVATMQKYLREENTEIETETLQYIASVSDGAMRDALSVLDQCLSFYAHETVTLEKVLKLLGAVDRKVLFEFADALSAFDGGKALNIIDAAARDGRDIGQFSSDCAKHFRDLLVARQDSGEKILDYTKETIRKLQAQAARFEDETLALYIRAFSELQNELRYSPHPRLALEVCAVKLCHPSVLDKPEALLARLEKLERLLENGAPPGVSAAKPAVSLAEAEQSPVSSKDSPADLVPASEPPQAAAAIPPAPSNITPAVSPKLVAEMQKDWAVFCGDFRPPLKTMLPLCGIELNGGILQMVCGDESSMRYLKDRQPKIMEKLAERFSLPESANLAFTVRDGYNKQIAVADSKTASDTLANDEWAAFGQQMDIGGGW
ncbi:MAG: DNA polymerase III subunit gamma/tau [Clostridiales bacterium]|nr:DNA polymerase III subunit gamma/tau [Clostridiales bacterium]